MSRGNLKAIETGRNGFVWNRVALNPLSNDEHPKLNWFLGLYIFRDAQIKRQCASNEQMDVESPCTPAQLFQTSPWPDNLTHVVSVRCSEATTLTIIQMHRKHVLFPRQSGPKQKLPGIAQSHPLSTKSPQTTRVYHHRDGSKALQRFTRKNCWCFWIIPSLGGIFFRLLTALFFTPSPWTEAFLLMFLLSFFCSVVSFSSLSLFSW